MIVREETQRVPGKLVGIEGIEKSFRDETSEVSRALGRGPNGTTLPKDSTEMGACRHLGTLAEKGEGVQVYKESNGTLIFQRLSITDLGIQMTLS